MTLHERHGGVPTVRRIVSACYRDVLPRATLARQFEGVDQVRRIEHQVAVTSHVPGQPASALKGAAMAPGDIDAVMATVAGTRGAIVTRCAGW